MNAPSELHEEQLLRARGIVETKAQKFARPRVDKVKMLGSTLCGVIDELVNLHQLLLPLDPSGPQYLGRLKMVLQQAMLEEA
jgi:hypothetical protein